MRSWIMVTLLAVLFAVGSFFSSNLKTEGKKLSPVESISQSAGY